MKRTQSTIDSVERPSWKLPKSERALEAVETFSPIEKGVFVLLVAILIATVLGLLWKVNNSFMVSVPDNGGTLKEGIIGSPRFVNPLLSVSDADRDLSALVYSGLLKPRTDGTLEPDLAAEYSVSPDGLIYTFAIRDDAYFHDGKPVTADDVEFTVKKAQDPDLKSPKRVNWEGVTIEKDGAKTVRFILKQPYAPFIDNMTIGILPKHIWESIDSDDFPFSNFNVEPIGSGPYKVKNLKRDSGGIPVYYHLKPFDKYVAGKPYISNIIVRFFNNESELLAAYKSGKVDAIHNISPEAAIGLRDAARIEQAHLSRVFGIFFNQNQANVFAAKETREALDAAIDKQALVDHILMGYGVPLDGPMPPGLLEGDVAAAEASTTDRLTAAASILENAGWKKDENGIFEKSQGKDKDPLKLAFSISTSDTPELKAVAERVANEWRALGADVRVLVFELGDLNQNVIRARKYDALLFGMGLGRDLDFYPFWHSSQRNDPGLNVAEYANIKADKLLEEARSATDEAARLEKYREFDAEVKKDVPAVFLYSPDFIYVLPRSIKGAGFGEIVTASDRLVGIGGWYIETNNVWKAFAEGEDAAGQ